MGQFESCIDYKSNDELINGLIENSYIHSINVEKVFRSVDRGLYYTNDNEVNPYTDEDWQSGDIHLCSPTDYATALESLDLHKGHKFLNIGSGIGYFSTLAGLLLGVNGVNHGIEIHSSLIDMAYQKLEIFKRNSAAIDYFEFCEPVFIKGNACELMPVGYYDRVNCGAEVPLAKSSFMKALIKIGGVLVMPLKGDLVKITRIGERSWRTIEALNEVTIPDLVVAEKCSSMNVSKFPTVEPLSLQELCRSNIRASIRNCLNESQPALKMRTKCKPNKSFDQHLLDESQSKMINLRNYLNEVRILEEAAADRYIFDSTSRLEVIEEDSDEDNDEDNNGDDVDAEEKNTSEQCDKSLLKKTASDTKKKGSAAKCFEQNKILPENPENTKRMRKNTLSSTVKYLSNRRSWDPMFNISLEFHDNDDDNNGDDVDVDENNTSEQCDKSLLKKTASDAKKKGSEAKCSEQNKSFSEKPENTRTMRMNTLSSTVENISDNHSTNSRSWETVSNDLSESHYDEENNHLYEDAFYTNLVDEVMSEYNRTDDEIAGELKNYRFLSNRKENELSKLLKFKINLLPVPDMLKAFLNYNIDD